MSPRPRDHEFGITKEMLESRFTFDAALGIFLHINGHRNGSTYPGKPAGFRRKDGYLQIKIDGRPILAHRLVWFWMTGAWPPLYIDHINGDRSDNRYENLRCADKSTNHSNNFVANKNNLSTGARCVYIKKPRGTRKGGYVFASVRIRGKRHYLGKFDTIEAASAARDALVLESLPGKRGATKR